MGLWERLRGGRNRELDEEIQAHLRMAIQDRVERGESPEKARQAALREFGNPELVKEVTRDTWGWRSIARAGQDLRYAARNLRQNRGFTAVVVLTVALGVGANTAIFSVVHAVLTPLPIPQPERVVVVFTENASRSWHQFPASALDYRDWRASGVFSSLGCIADSGYNLRLGDRSDRIDGSSVNKEFFDAVDIQPELGRLFEERDMQPGADPVVLVSDQLWRSRFSGNRSAIGSKVVLNGIPRTIVGVLPRAFTDFGSEEIYDPMAMQKRGADSRGTRSLMVIGRLRPGISLAAAQKALADLAARQAADYPEDAGNTVLLQPIEEVVVQDSQTLVAILQGAVGLVLLIARANIANLLMARSTARAREMTVRAALGASQWRLVRQLLTENLLLAFLGGLLAVFPAWWGIHFIASFKLDALPDAELISLNWSVLAFNFALTLVTGVVFGLLPAWQACRTKVSDALKAASRTHSRGPHQRLRSVFVVGEIALTLVLLAGAGLMLQSFFRMRAAWPGYNPHGLLTARIELADRKYDDDRKRTDFFNQVVDQVRRLPGVRAVAAAGSLPTTSDVDGTGLRFPDRPEPRIQDVPVVFLNTVTPDYLRIMQIPLLRGRGLQDSDTSASAPVVLVDEWTARHFWPTEDALGKSVTFGSEAKPRQIVGVVGVVQQDDLAKLFKAQSGLFYLPMRQYAKSGMSLLVRAEGDPVALAPAVRRVVQALDPDQPLFMVESMEEARAAGRATQKLAAWLLGAFGTMALLLATIGVYGVMAFSVGCRAHEFGIRMSLGAQPGDVLKLAGRQAVALNAAGIAAGVLGAYGLTRLLASLLYGVNATDPVTLAAVTAVLAAVTLLAGYIPARRATQLDPVRVLRDE